MSCGDVQKGPALCPKKHIVFVTVLQVAGFRVISVRQNLGDMLRVMIAFTCLLLAFGESIPSHAKTQGEMASAPAADRRRLATGVTVHAFGASTMCAPNTVCPTPTLWLGRGTPITPQVDADLLIGGLGPTQGLDYGSGQTTSWGVIGGDSPFSFEDTFVAARSSNVLDEHYICGSSELSGRNVSADTWFLCEGSTCLWEEWASKQDHPFIGVVLSGAECGNLSVHIIPYELELNTAGSCGSVPAWSQVGSGRKGPWEQHHTRPGPSAHLVSQSTWRFSSTHCRKLVYGPPTRAARTTRHSKPPQA